MINLTDEVLASPRIPMYAKLRELFWPESYLAADLGDFISSQSSLPDIWYKTLRYEPCAFVRIHNVRLTLRATLHQESLYEMTDKTGAVSLWWTEYTYGRFHTSQHRASIEGLDHEEGVLFHEIVFIHQFSHRLNHLMIAKLEPPSPRAPKKAPRKQPIWDIFNPFPNQV